MKPALAIACGLRVVSALRATEAVAARVDEAMSRAWLGLDGKSAAPSTLDKTLVAADPVVASYGEVTSDGARSVFEALELGGGQVFADLGSGVGRLAAQAYVEAGVDRAVAVEFFESRHDRAVEAWRRFCLDDGPSLRSDFAADGVDFLRADVLDADLFGVTRAFVSNYCFDDQTNARLADRLLTLDGLGLVAASRPLPAFPDPAARILVDMTWSPRVVVTVYDLRRR